MNFPLSKLVKKIYQNTHTGKSNIFLPTMVNVFLFTCAPFVFCQPFEETSNALGIKGPVCGKWPMLTDMIGNMLLEVKALCVEYFGKHFPYITNCFGDSQLGTDE